MCTWWKVADRLSRCPLLLLVLLLFPLPSFCFSPPLSFPFLSFLFLFLFFSFVWFLRKWEGASQMSFIAPGILVLTKRKGGQRIVLSKPHQLAAWERHVVSPSLLAVPCWHGTTCSPSVFCFFLFFLRAHNNLRRSLFLKSLLASILFPNNSFKRPKL